MMVKVQRGKWAVMHLQALGDGRADSGLLGSSGGHSQGRNHLSGFRHGFPNYSTERNRRSSVKIGENCEIYIGIDLHTGKRGNLLLFSDDLPCLSTNSPRKSSFRETKTR